MRRGSPWLIGLVCLCFSGAALSVAAEPTSTGAPAANLCVQDFRGRQLCLEKPAERIVCLIESALSGLFMLGAEDRIVGVSTNVYQEPVFSFYAAMDPRIAARGLPTPGNWDFVNVESVVALQPDLVLIWSHQEESIRSLEARGIPVFGVFIRSFADIHEEIKALGVLTGTSHRAEELLRTAQDALVALKARLEALRSERPPRVYFMWAQGDLETSGRKSTVHELIELAGGENVCGSMEQEHLVISRETLLALDPEIIVMWYNERKDSRDILGHPLWQSVSAVRNARVHELPDVFTCDLWTLKYIHAVLLVARWCHPGRFTDTQPEDEARELFRTLYGDRSPYIGSPPKGPGG